MRSGENYNIHFVKFAILLILCGIANRCHLKFFAHLTSEGGEELTELQLQVNSEFDDDENGKNKCEM